MLYVLIRLQTSDVRGFNELWARELLPHWQRYADHVGSFVDAEGPQTEILRLMAFEDVAAYESFRHYMNSPAGESLNEKLRVYDFSVDSRLLVQAPVD